MTDEEAIALGQRWAALDLPWMPGMVTIDECRIIDVDDDGWVRNQNSFSYWEVDGELPDFRDPATLGCLLAQTREVYDLDGDGWNIITGYYDGPVFAIQVYAKMSLSEAPYEPLSVGSGRSLAEALIAALEARND